MEHFQKQIINIFRLYISYMRYALVAIVLYVCVASLFQTFNGLFLALPVFILSAFLIIILCDWGTHKINRPHFTFLLEMARFFPAKYAKDLLQNISDLRIEYNEALVEKNLWRARLIIADYYLGLSWSAVKWIAERAKELVGLMPKVN